jgi:hypothetical protein
LAGGADGDDAAHAAGGDHDSHCLRYNTYIILFIYKLYIYVYGFLEMQNAPTT